MHKIKKSCLDVNNPIIEVSDKFKIIISLEPAYDSEEVIISWLIYDNINKRFIKTIYSSEQDAIEYINQLS